MLEQSDIAHYLLSLGLVKPRAVVEEDLTIIDVSRRNCVFVASTGDGPTHVVKQGLPHTAHTLDHEAAVLRALARKPQLAQQVPSVAHHDPDAACLVLRSPPRARDWSEHHRDGRFRVGMAGGLGRALAALHAIPADAVPARPPGIDPMWGLELPEPSYESVLQMSAGSCDLVARLQGSKRLSQRLRTLRHQVRSDAIVHGDLRWDNCLVFAAPGSTRRTRVLVIDWELAGSGAAAFDVATALAEYLRVWVGSIPIVEPTDPSRLVAHAAHPLWRMQPAMAAFWSAYRSARPQAPSLTEVIELTAVRLLQIAVEHADTMHTPTAHVVTLLQLADNMLDQPAHAAVGLLAMRV
jgi:Ser/Thr protein kinase RdoA (MazF antagonist)